MVEHKSVLLTDFILFIFGAVTVLFVVVSVMFLVVVIVVVGVV